MILIGEGTYACYEARYQEKQGDSEENIYNIRKKAIEKYEKALFMNEDYSLNVIDFLINAYNQCIQTCTKIEINPNSKLLVTANKCKISHKLHDLCLLLYNTCDDIDFDERKSYCIRLGNLFYNVYNYSAATKYRKLAYEYCLRSSDHTDLETHKKQYIQSKKLFAKEKPLRFSVGDVVECLVERGDIDGDDGEGEDDVVEWKLGKVVELYYRDESFLLDFTAPYRLLLINNDDYSPAVASPADRAHTTSPADPAPTADSPTLYAPTADSSADSTNLVTNLT